MSRIGRWPIQSEAEILNIIDDHARLCVGSDARRITRGPDVVTSFRAASARWGIPAGMLTDNGAIFTAKQRGEGRVALEIELGALGVRFDHSRPYHPQTCGKVERFHQTMKKWLTSQPRAATVAELQRQLDVFVSYYNTERPHRALAPHSLWRPTEPGHRRCRPARSSPPTTGSAKDRIDSGGSVTLRHNSRLHHIGLGTRLAGTRVLLLIDDLHIRVIARDTGQLLRELILDPTRDYQPRGLPPGPPRPDTRLDATPRRASDRCPPAPHAAGVKAGRRPPAGPRP